MIGRLAAYAPRRQLAPPLAFKRFNSVKYPPPPSHYETKTNSSKSHTFKISALLFLLGATISYNYPLYNLVEKFYPLPEDNDFESINKYNSNLESQLQAIPLVSNLKNDTNYIEFRGWNHLNLAPSGLSNFHGTLLTPGGVAIPPLSFHCQKTGNDVVIVHLGRRLSGFPFIVHGGITGMVIEETFKANLQKEYPNLNINQIHTKNLQLNYKFPTFVNQFIVINSKLNIDESDLANKTYHFNCDVRTLDGKLLVHAAAKLTSDVAPDVDAASRPLNIQPTKSKWLW